MSMFQEHIKFSYFYSTLFPVIVFCSHTSNFLHFTSSSCRDFAVPPIITVAFNQPSVDHFQFIPRIAKTTKQVNIHFLIASCQQTCDKLTVKTSYTQAYYQLQLDEIDKFVTTC